MPGGGLLSVVLYNNSWLMPSLATGQHEAANKAEGNAKLLIKRILRK
jgi:hypothetical protein